VHAPSSCSLVGHMRLHDDVPRRLLALFDVSGGDLTPSSTTGCCHTTCGSTSWPRLLAASLGPPPHSSIIGSTGGNAALGTAIGLRVWVWSLRITAHPKWPALRWRSTAPSCLTN
jgi:hypothetical protein